MEQKDLNFYKKAEKQVSWLNALAVVIGIVAFIFRKQYFTVLMTLALIILLMSLVVVMHLINKDDEERRENVFYHLIAFYLILTICGFFTSAKTADYNSFSYVFINSILIGFLMLIAIQIIFEGKLLIFSIMGFVSGFILALFQINTALNIVIALVMGAVIFAALTKLMRPAGIYGVAFGIINLVISVVLLLKPIAAIGFYGHVVVNYAIIALFYVLPVLIAKSETVIEDVKEKEKVSKEIEIIKTEKETAGIEDNSKVKEEVVSLEQTETEEEKGKTIIKEKDLENRNRWIIKKYKSLPLDELMKAPVSALWGVSDSDAVLLKEAFNIKTVEDLATNKFFNWAKEIVEQAENK